MPYRHNSLGNQFDTVWNLFKLFICNKMYQNGNPIEESIKKVLTCKYVLFFHARQRQVPGELIATSMDDEWQYWYQIKNRRNKETKYEQYLGVYIKYRTIELKLYSALSYLANGYYLKLIELRKIMAFLSLKYCAYYKFCFR
jgi:hypothetical protein